MATMTEIETLTRKHSAAREQLAAAVRALTGDIDASKRSYMPGIKKAVERVKDTEAALHGAIELSPDLFEKPKSRTFYGIRVGYKKAPGKIEFDDADQLVKLIRKHYPEQFDVLVKTEHKPLKKGLEQLTAEQLKKLGIDVPEDGDDVVFIKDTASEVDKIVAALLAEQLED